MISSSHVKTSSHHSADTTKTTLSVVSSKLQPGRQVQRANMWNAKLAAMWLNNQA